MSCGLFAEPLHIIKILPLSVKSFNQTWSYRGSALNVFRSSTTDAWTLSGSLVSTLFSHQANPSHRSIKTKKSETVILAILVNTICAFIFSSISWSLRHDFEHRSELSQEQPESDPVPPQASHPKIQDIAGAGHVSRNFPEGSGSRTGRVSILIFARTCSNASSRDVARRNSASVGPVPAGTKRRT